MLKACTAAVLVGVMRLLACPFDSSWCLVCELCVLAVVYVDFRCSMPFVFLGGVCSFLRVAFCTCVTVS